MRGPSITSSVHASEEIRAAAATYRARGAPGDAEVADRLEAAARNAATRERTWQLAGYSAQEQTQLSEFWWRNELAFARMLRAQMRRSPRELRGNPATGQYR